MAAMMTSIFIFVYFLLVSFVTADNEQMIALSFPPSVVISHLNPNIDEVNGIVPVLLNIYI